MYVEVDEEGVRAHARGLVRWTDALTSRSLAVEGCGSSTAEAAVERLDGRVRSLLRASSEGVGRLAGGAVDAAESTLAADARAVAAAESARVKAAFSFGGV